MSADEPRLELIRAVKARYEPLLLGLPNVCGVGVGLRQRGGVLTDEPCIVVMVERKVTPDGLDPANIIPAELDGVPVDVQETGRINA